MNTDAEGRLVMADAIVRAGEESAVAIVDIATLTGAQLVALGSRVYGVMANNDDLRSALVAAADASGEQGWPMPLPEELRKSLDSEIGRPVQHRRQVRRDARRRAVPAGVRAGLASRGHISTSRGPRGTRARRTATPRRAATGVPIRTLLEWWD